MSLRSYGNVLWCTRFSYSQVTSNDTLDQGSHTRLHRSLESWTRQWNDTRSCWFLTCTFRSQRVVPWWVQPSLEPAATINFISGPQQPVHSQSSDSESELPVSKLGVYACLWLFLQFPVSLLLASKSKLPADISIVLADLAVVLADFSILQSHFSFSFSCISFLQSYITALLAHLSVLFS